MSTFSGPQGKHAARRHKETKRAEAILRAKRAQARRVVEAAQTNESED